MALQGPQEYVLGIDLGTNSLGWAIVGLVDGEPAGLIRAGARVFEAAMDGNTESGQEQSRNRERREARLHRRQLWRHARRVRKVFNLLQRFSLLPGGKTPAEDRQNLLNSLDKQILGSDWFASKRASGKFPEPDQTLPYILRASALNEALEPHFLGRAFYHLAQRRGFLSNRKIAPKKNEDDGEVKKTIGELRQSMGANTLGEYLSQLSPAAQRIRGPARWTARDMYEQEFDAIWTAQAKHHPDLLTQERRKELRLAIFYQRRLWFDPNSVGKCELEPNHSRASKHLLISQRFRLLQTVNNLKVTPLGDVERALTPEEREKLVGVLELKEDMTFKGIRKLLSLSDCEFNVERGGRKSIEGNRTAAKLYKIFGERWLQFSSEERDRVVEDLHSIEKPEKMRGRGVRAWGLSPEAAEKFANTTLEPDYFNLSRCAMEKLMPALEKGTPYAEARKEVYPESFSSNHPLPVLPRVSEVLGEVRNPAVMRSLTELRKVVNAVVRTYGKPTEVHIELARDLKKSKKARQAIWKANREKEEARAGARKAIEAMVPNPKPDDVRKYLLAKECHWTCPYTGKHPISREALFGPEPVFDIEHIIPFSRSLDNSFQNLTLCYLPENRERKGNRTPHEAYAGDPQSYEAMLDRVKKFSGERRMAAEKLKRFMMNDEELQVFLDEFRNRQLNDTAYASSLAAKYVGTLYGGVIDEEKRRRVQVTSGQATSYFRNLWKLNAILNDGPTTNGGATPKSRDDHRHHAVDAVVIALTDAAMVKRLSDAAQRAPLEGRRRFASLEGRWPNFTDTIRAEVSRIVVSHRVSKKVSGALHNETNYSPKEYGGNVRRHRVALTKLTEKHIMSEEVIADAGVRKLVREKFLELGGGDSKKVFAAPENLPCFVTADGRRIPVKKVRIQETVKTRQLGAGHRARHVKPGGNHHLEIFGEPGPAGQDKKWETLGVVSMLEAYQRLSKREPLVKHSADPPWEFRFSLAPKEILAFDAGPYKGSLFVVASISQEEKTEAVKVEMVPIRDAREQKAIRKARLWVTKSPNELRKWGARKVVVSPLGEVTEADD